VSDAFATIESHVVAIGEFLEKARRYRPLVTEADALLTDTAAIAAEVRRASRENRADEASRSEARLREIVAVAERTLADFRSGARYQAVVAALANEPTRAAAADLVALFTDVEAHLPSGRLYLPLVAKRGKDVLEPDAAAEALAGMAAEGIEPQRGPGVGGDDSIHPIRFFESLVAIDAPLVVIVEAEVIVRADVPILRAPDLGEVLVYVPRLRASFVVGIRGDSPDDWIAIRAGGYPQYRDACRELVTRRGLRMEII
jgi:hypothetical protein